MLNSYHKSFQLDYLFRFSLFNWGKGNSGVNDGTANQKNLMGLWFLLFFFITFSATVFSFFMNIYHGNLTNMSSNCKNGEGVQYQT